MGLVDGILNFQKNLTENLGGGAVSDVRPRGIAHFPGKDKGMRYIYTSDMSLVSMFEIYGTRHHFNGDMIESALVGMAQAMKSSLKNVGCTIQICMHHDRHRAPSILNSVMDPMSRAAKAMGIDIDIITQDWKNVLARYTAGEYIYMVVWTHPQALVPAVLKQERKNLKQAPVSNSEQNPTALITSLQTMHTTFVANAATALRGADLVFSELTPEEMCRAMRVMFDEEWTNPDWRPWSADNEDNHTLPSLPSLVYDNLKTAWVMPESLAHQIVPRDAEIINDEMVMIGSRIHYPFMNKLQPQLIQGFRGGFFKSAISQQYPWRITWTIRGGQGPGVFNSALAKVMHLFSAQNRKILQAYEFIRNYTEEEDGTPIAVQTSYDTWVDAPVVDKKAIAMLRKQQAQFAGAVQAWGTQETVGVTGDPYAVLISTIPGLNWRSPAPQTLAPVEEIFKLLPLADRAASPWKAGLPFRTPDGKLFPYTPMSTHQAAWITFGVAPMGSGKSVLANVENYAYIFNPEISDVPYIGIIDVGPSSSGLIRTVKETLPLDKKHYACEFLLENSTENSINVFDTEVGCRNPFPAHYDFLVNFLTLLATPVEAENPYDGIQQFARLCLEAAYRVTTKVRPKLYKKSVEPEVDDWISATGYAVDKRTTWWEIVDAIFCSRNPVLAAKAQRYAVPILEDIAQMAKEPVLKQQYEKIRIPNGESIPEYFARRIQESILTYAVLREPTKFDIGSARVMSIDLDRFKGQGAEGSKTMAIMYMVCQQVMGGRFYQDYSDLTMVPDMYKEFHKERIANLKELPKRLVMDEVHRITTNGGAVARQFIADLCTRARESRKWGVSFAFWTQMYEDIPKEIVELTTTLYVLGIGTADGAKDIVETYGMAPEIADAIYNLPPPGPQGSSMMALYRTKDGKPYYHILTLTIGLYMLWALSSTKNERVIRDALTKEFGFGRALEILVELYPRNVSKIIEDRQRELAKQGQQGNVVQDIIKECIEFGRSGKRKELAA